MLKRSNSRRWRGRGTAERRPLRRRPPYSIAARGGATCAWLQLRPDRALHRPRAAKHAEHCGNRGEPSPDGQRAHDDTVLDPTPTHKRRGCSSRGSAADSTASTQRKNITLCSEARKRAESEHCEPIAHSRAESLSLAPSKPSMARGRGAARLLHGACAPCTAQQRTRSAPHGRRPDQACAEQHNNSSSARRCWLLELDKVRQCTLEVARHAGGPSFVNVHKVHLPKPYREALRSAARKLRDAVRQRSLRRQSPPAQCNTDADEPNKSPHACDCMSTPAASATCSTRTSRPTILRETAPSRRRAARGGIAAAQRAIPHM